jgi:nitrogen regulatory protein PII
MKMIWAVISKEFTERVIEALDRAGIGAMTRLQVTGPYQDTLLLDQPNPDKPREVLMIAVPDAEVAKTVMVIRAHARPEEAGRHNAEPATAGKIFVTYIDESFTIRTAGKTGAGS